jgi:hypothetical protein
MSVADAVAIGNVLYSVGSTLIYGIAAGANGLASMTHSASVSLFSRPEPPPPVEDTVAKLERVRETVVVRERRLWERMEQHREKAAENACVGRLREAKMEIRLRMLYDGQIQNAQRTLTAIESHLVAIQSAVLNREVFLALHEGSRALGHRGHDEDAVDDVLAELDEQHDRTRAIMDIIQENPPDEDAIENELALLIGPATDGADLPPPEMLIFPAPPTTDPDDIVLGTHASNPELKKIKQ